MPRHRFLPRTDRKGAGGRAGGWFQTDAEFGNDDVPNPVTRGYVLPGYIVGQDGYVFINDLGETP
jgi:hypothetical protein